MPFWVPLGFFVVVRLSRSGLLLGRSLATNPTSQALKFGQLVTQLAVGQPVQYLVELLRQQQFQHHQFRYHGNVELDATAAGD
ncbi:Uncharacterised protein [Mycobacteroides abscessus subsp. abscessus]|nr:Uncharacterised protein [Mycobacteroides abscessus subsp. abscessus]